MVNVPWFALVATALLFTGVGFAIDPDGDGIPNARELALGTSGVKEDTDGDGLLDSDEWARGLNPLESDMDQDGVLDGAERAVECVLRRDCDSDGLRDDREGDTYDPLDPDTFDVGLSDGVVQTFEQAGQPPSRDDDRDGIPDGWEQQDGLIEWGDFEPVAGRPDLLVEYIHVEGPQSGRFNLDFRPAYDAVVAMFADRGIHLQWVETTVETLEEVRPGFLDTDDIGYYDALFQRGASSLNPFVTTIILNPQQTQEDLAGDILGAAFLRSMVATLDYGAHTVVKFVEDESQGLTLGGRSLSISPVIESHVIGARPEQARLLQFASEGIVDLCSAPCADDFWFITRQQNADGSELRLRWTWEPNWFQTAPNITTQDGAYLQLRVRDVEVNQANLAGTIAHELGHTLGLCHAHEAECYSQFAAADISTAAIASTTMSYSAPQGTLNFLDSEWQQLEQYITCPPQEPLVLLALDAPAEDLLAAKYLDSFTQASNARECGDAQPIAEDLPASASGDSRPAVWLSVYGAAAIVAGAAVVFWFRPDGR